jgi:pimeloyl-ACP methyl ester carboxylesterase
VEVVRVLGLEIAYERVGSGPPLVLAHGAGDDHRAWRPQVESLSDAFTVIAWDEPGAGRSTDVPPTFTLADYGHCLAAVIESVGLGPAHVCGISWGGTVVQELYRLRADLVASLILADTYAGWKGSLPPKEVRARVEAADGPLPGLFAGGPPAEYLAVLEAMERDARPGTLRVQLRLMAGADLREGLPRIAVPTLLIWGEDDARSPLAVAHHFHRAIPGATLVEIPRCGHLSNLERPAAFNAAVRTFCS